MHLYRSVRSWRRCALAFAIALATAGAVVVTVPPVAANATISSCDAHQFCMWQNANYNNNQSGSYWARTYGNYTNFAWHYVGDSFNDQASSVYNSRSYRVGVNRDDNPASGTFKYCWPGQYKNSNLTLINWPGGGGGVNDSISAWWFSDNSSNCGPGF
jgi:hypothetical protein